MQWRKSFQGAKILIIEDKEDDSEAAKRLHRFLVDSLGNIGYEPRTCRDLSELPLEMSLFTMDLIIIIHVRYKVKGIGFLKKTRESVGSDVPLILLSYWNNREMRKALKQFQARFVYLPLDIDNLKCAIRRLLRKSFRRKH